MRGGRCSDRGIGTGSTSSGTTARTAPERRRRPSDLQNVRLNKCFLMVFFIFRLVLYPNIQDSLNDLGHVLFFLSLIFSQLNYTFLTYPQFFVSRFNYYDISS